MRCYYDLHIHSTLSPCGEEEMTPNNIVNMAAIKELDFIAVTDHNAIHNVPAALEVAKDLPIIVVPGIEVQTKEDVHLLCLFKQYEVLEHFYQTIIVHQQVIAHNEKKFGSQNVLNEADEVIGSLTQSLYGSIMLSTDEVVKRVLALGGGVIPCHLDRKSYSLIANLGFLPPDLPVKTIELSPQCDRDKFFSQHAYLKGYQCLINSDAHELTAISEATHGLDLDEKTIEALFLHLFGG